MIALVTAPIGQIVTAFCNYLEADVSVRCCLALTCLLIHSPGRTLLSGDVLPVLNRVPSLSHTLRPPLSIFDNVVAAKSKLCEYANVIKSCDFAPLTAV